MVLSDHPSTSTSYQHPYQNDHLEAEPVAFCRFFQKANFHCTGHIPSVDTTAHIPLRVAIVIWVNLLAVSAVFCASQTIMELRHSDKQYQ